MLRVNGYYKTCQVISINTEHKTTALASGQIVQILELDEVYNKMLLKIQGFGLTWVDTEVSANLEYFN